MVLNTDGNSPLSLAEVNFILFLSKSQPVIYIRIIRIVNPSRGETTPVGKLSCQAGKVTQTSGTTFLQINALACLTGTTLG